MLKPTVSMQFYPTNYFVRYIVLIKVLSVYSFVGIFVKEHLRYNWILGSEPRNIVLNSTRYPIVLNSVPNYFCNNCETNTCENEGKHLIKLLIRFSSEISSFNKLHLEFYSQFLQNGKCYSINVSIK